MTTLDSPVPTFSKHDVIELLSSHTYEQIATRTGWSRGSIYRAALEANARKTESRIRERARERNARQVTMLQEMMNQTVTADCLDFLESIPKASIDLIATSPPYNIGVGYGDAAGDMMRPLRYFGWLCSIVSEYERILRPGGVVAMVVGGTRDADGNIIPLDWILERVFRETKLTFQNRVVWPSRHGLTPRTKLAHRHETIVIFSKGTPAPNFGSARTPQIEFAKRAFKGPRKGQPSSHPLGAWPSDVWNIPHLGSNNSEKTDHPAQYPLAIAKRLVMLYSLPGDLVLDSFSGSGTTQEAALACGRRFVGADLFYEDIRAERLANAKPYLVSPLSGVTPESAAFWAAHAVAQNTAATSAVWQAKAQRVDAEPVNIPSSDENKQLWLDLLASEALSA